MVGKGGALATLLWQEAGCKWNRLGMSPPPSILKQFEHQKGQELHWHPTTESGHASKSKEELWLLCDGGNNEDAAAEEVGAAHSHRCCNV